MIVNIGDIIIITCSGVRTYHKMVIKHPDGGGKFLTVLRDGTKHPQTSGPEGITYEQLINPKGYYIDIYSRAGDSHD